MQDRHPHVHHINGLLMPRTHINEQLNLLHLLIFMLYSQEIDNII